MALAILTILAGAAGGRAVAQEPPDEAISTAPTAPSSTSIVSQPALFTADDLLLVEVSADGEILSDCLGSYSSRAGVFVPLGETARLLDLAITVDPTRGRAEGWVASPSDGFRLDLVSGRAHAGGKDLDVSSTQAMLFGGEIFVRLDLFQQLLPLAAKVDASALTLTLAPTSHLPFEDRRELQARRAGLIAGADGREEPFLRVATPYTAFTPPSIDIDLATTGGNEAPRRGGEYDIRLAGDLAWAGLQVFAGSDESLRMSNVRVLLERKDPDGKIAGPFGATRSDAGDTYTPALALGAQSQGGRGFAITSAPLEQASVFDHVDLRGELPAGYQVELYVNEVLRASQAQPLQGQYQFLSVPLSYGENVIRLVFYGPHGERREEVRRFSAAGGQLAKGQTVYNFGIVQQGRPLFDVGRTPLALATPTALILGGSTGLGGLPTSAPSATPDDVTPGDGTWRIAASLSHGITSAITATAGFAQYTPRTGDTREAGVFSLSSSLAGAFLQGDVAGDNRGGTAVAIGIAGHFEGVSVLARDAEYAGGFIDEIVPDEFGSKIDLRRDTLVSFDFIGRLAGASLPIDLRFRRDEFVDGEQRYEAQARVSEVVGRYLISSGLDYQSDAGGPITANQTLVGALDASGLTYGKWQLRGDVAYQVLPSARINSALLTADRQIGRASALHLAVGHAFDANQTSFQVGETWRLRAFDLSLVSSYTTNPSDVRLGLQISLGLTWDPLHRRYRALGPGAADGGAALIDAFISPDGTNLRRPSDQGVSGLVVQGGARTVKTDASGSAIVTGLGDGALAQVQFDPESIDNPYLTAPPRQIRFVPRPGRVVVIPYPLTLTGEVELQILFAAAGAPPRGLSALDIELADVSGAVVARGRTEYDGTAVLERLKPGAYVLQLDPDQSSRLGLTLTAPVKVVIPAGGGFAGRFSANVALVAASAAPTGSAATPAAVTAASQATPPLAHAAPVRTPRAVRQLHRARHGRRSAKPPRHHQRIGHGRHTSSHPTHRRLAGAAEFCRWSCNR
jgi:hypothetical protein